MDIQINADQGRGKTFIAPKIAALFGGIYREVDAYPAGPIFNQTALKRKIIDSRADVVVIDNCLPWFTPHAKTAVQDARNSLRRNIVAIYCVQDAAVGVPDNGPFIPLGFVRAEPLVCIDDPTPEQVEKLKNAFKESAGQFFVVGGEDASVGMDFGTRDDVGITELSVSSDQIYVKESRTKEILLRMAREIHNNGVARDKEELAAVYAHYGADSVDALAPTFYADAHDRITPILDRVRCYILVVRLAKKGHAKDVKKLFEPLGIARIYDAPTTAAHALLTDLQLLDHEYKRT